MVILSELKQLLSRIYYDQSGSEGSFSALIPLYRVAKRLDGRITIKIVSEFLRGVKSYVSHKKSVNRFKRRSFLCLYPGEIFCLDLIFFGKKAILNCVDGFSKKGYSRELINKTAAETLSKFKEILDQSHVIPKFLFVDDGGEFKASFRQFCKEKKIVIYSSTTSIKSFPAEIYNLQIKRITGRITTFRNSKNYSATLQQAVSIYNNTALKSLDGLSPNQAARSKNIPRLQEFFFKKKADKVKNYLKKKPLFKLGDKVRKKTQKGFKQREHMSRYSERIYTITRVNFADTPITYCISDHGKRIFYSAQLALLTESDHESSSLRHEILAILSKKKIPIKWLRSGKPIDFEDRYLVRLGNADEPKYLTFEQLKDYDNGYELLMKFRKDHP